MPIEQYSRCYYTPFNREMLLNAVVFEDLFESLQTYLQSQGLKARGGQIINVTLFPVHQPPASAQQQQRSSRYDTKEIKENCYPEGWALSPYSLQAKDTMHAR